MEALRTLTLRNEIILCKIYFVLKGIAWGLPLRNNSPGSKKVNAVNYVVERDDRKRQRCILQNAERRMTLSLIKNKTQDHKQR